MVRSLPGSGGSEASLRNESRFKTAQFLIKIGQGLFQQFAMSRIFALFQLVKDLLPSESKILPLPAASRSFRGESHSSLAGFLTCLSLLSFD